MRKILNAELSQLIFSDYTHQLIFCDYTQDPAFLHDNLICAAERHFTQNQMVFLKSRAWDISLTRFYNLSEVEFSSLSIIQQQEQQLFNFQYRVVLEVITENSRDDTLLELLFT